MLKNAFKKLNPLAPDGLSSPRSGFLFPATDAAVDGEECLHDCETCTVHYPRRFEIEETHKIYGNVDGWSRHLIVATGKHDWKKHVEDERGSVMEAVGRWKEEREQKGDRLMLSASNMPLPDAPDAKHISTEESVSEQREHGTTCLLLPAFVVLSGVTPDNVTEILDSKWFRGTPETTDSLPSQDQDGQETSTSGRSPSVSSPPAVKSPSVSSPSAVKSPSAPPSSATPRSPSSNITAKSPLSPARSSPKLDLPSGVTLQPYPHDSLILLCSQKTRDARCGQSAPLLKREFERHLRSLSLQRDLDDNRQGGVAIVFVSHVGGHKYSANCLVYRSTRAVTNGEWRSINLLGSPDKKSPAGSRPSNTDVEDVEATNEAAQCIWLARVIPEDCENIVRYTILQGKVVKPARQLRGGFDRGTGKVSW